MAYSYYAGSFQSKTPFDKVVLINNSGNILPHPVLAIGVRMIFTRRVVVDLMPANSIRCTLEKYRIAGPDLD